MIVFGAFVRLSNAGLSCPDWPTCYGRAAWPTAASQVVYDAATEIRPVEVHKAWREQFHRMIAGTLGVLVLTLALLAARRRRYGVLQVIVASALVALAIPLYMQGQHASASGLAMLGEAVLLFAALRWSNLDLSRIAVLTLAVIMFQALLGMWTVTWKLKPIVVMAHLAGRIRDVRAAVWTAYRATDLRSAVRAAPKRAQVVIVGIVLLRNADRAWAAGHRPTTPRSPAASISRTCLGRWWPHASISAKLRAVARYRRRLRGRRAGRPARTAIHLAHRLFAIVVVSGICCRWRATAAHAGASAAGRCCWVADAVAQIALGIANVLAGLPLAIAAAHNAVAALLLLTLVVINFALSRAPSSVFR